MTNLCKDSTKLYHGHYGFSTTEADGEAQPEGKQVPIHFSYRGSTPNVRLKQQSCSEVTDVDRAESNYSRPSPTLSQERNPKHQKNVNVWI